MPVWYNVAKTAVSRYYCCNFYDFVCSTPSLSLLVYSLFFLFIGFRGIGACSARRDAKTVHLNFPSNSKWFFDFISKLFAQLKSSLARTHTRPIADSTASFPTVPKRAHSNINTYAKSLSVHFVIVLFWFSRTNIPSVCILECGFHVEWWCCLQFTLWEPFRCAVPFAKWLALAVWSFPKLCGFVKKKKHKPVKNVHVFTIVYTIRHFIVGLRDEQKFT